jgi:CHAT domain-containing protein
MNQQKLAQELIHANNASQRKLLLEKNSDYADRELAHALKDTYYKSWTDEPKLVRNAALSLKSLLEIKPDEEISALKNWVEGISYLTKGKIEKAIESLDLATEKLDKINKKHLSAQPQVGKLYALALLGNYQEAIKTGENSLKIFEEFGDELMAGKVEKNIGNIIVRQDSILPAEKYYVSAIARFTKIGDLQELAMCETNLAENYVDLHDFISAEKYFALALEHTKQANMNFVEAEIQASLGNLAMLRGKYPEALRYLEIARRNFEELNVPHRSVIAEFEIANIYFELNLADEAYEIYQSVVEKLRKYKFRAEEALARVNFGKVALSKNELTTARHELKKAGEIYRLEKNLSGLASVKLAQANLEFLSNKFDQALKIIRETEKLLTTSENLPLKLRAKFRHGEVLRKLDKHARAKTVLTEVYQKSLQYENTNLAQISLNSLGQMALENNDRRQAEKYFKKSIKLIENLRSPLPSEEFRIAFLADKLAPFENLAQIYLAENKIEEAFKSIENARSRSLADVLQSVENKGVAKNPQNKKLQEKLESLREELNWFYSLQSRAEETEIEHLQAEAKVREKQIAAIMRQFESTKNIQVENSKNSPSESEINLKSLQTQLGEQRVLIEFVEYNDSFSAFVIDEKEIEYIADIATRDEIIHLLEGLQFQFGALRYGSENLGRFADILKQKADFYLHELYQKLLAPVKDLLSNKYLVIVPVSLLHYVPFQGLFDGEKYLVENNQVVTTPSALIWKILSRKQTQKPKNAFLMGFADSKIPLVNEEIKELKKIFQTSAEIFLDKRATFQNYTKHAENFDILHLACHGQFRPDNPLFSSLHLADGFITVRDICAQNLNAELATLSACETGLNKIYAGDEILGLARGFLVAGVHSIVLSLWTVNDQATKNLMKDFYTEQQLGQSVAASLQKAQKKCIRQNLHPYFWASFAIIGK